MAHRLNRECRVPRNDSIFWGALQGTFPIGRVDKSMSIIPQPGRKCDKEGIHDHSRGGEPRTVLMGHLVSFYRTTVGMHVGPPGV